MFTPKNFKTLIFVTNLAWYTGAVPYHFVKHSNWGYNVVGSFTKRRTYFAYANLFISAFYFLFILFRLFSSLLSEEKPTLDFLVRMGYLLLSYGLPCVLQVNTITCWKDIPRFLSQYIKFYKEIQVKYINKNDKGTRCMKFFSCVIFIGIATLIQNFIHIRKKPYQDYFLTSLLNDPVHEHAIIRYPIIFIQAWVWGNVWIFIFVYCFHWYMYMTCGVFVAKELNISIKNPRTHNSIRQERTTTRLLRTMQVLHRFWSENYEAWLCPLQKGIVMAVSTLGIYGLFKLSGPRSIVMGGAAMLALLYMATLFTKFGKYLDVSRKTLYNWQHSVSTTKYTKKFLKSVPEFRVNIGSFYVVQKLTVMSVMWAVLNNTITLFFI